MVFAQFDYFMTTILVRIASEYVSGYVPSAFFTSNL